MKGFRWSDFCDLSVAKSHPNLLSIINLKDENDKYALFQCLEQKCFDTFCYFVDCGANIYVKNMLGDPLLFDAVDKESFECVEKLLSRGAYVNCRDECRFTPLFDSLYCEFPKITLFLLKHKADVNALSKYDSTPLDLAFDSGHLRSQYEDPRESPQIKAIILAGGKTNKLKKKDIPPLFQVYFAKLALCKSASIAIRISLRKRRVHKDIVPMIEKMVFETREAEEWETEEQKDFLEKEGY
jgi:ankyrin repeat protein